MSDQAQIIRSKCSDVEELVLSLSDAASLYEDAMLYGSSCVQAWSEDSDLRAIDASDDMKMLIGKARVALDRLEAELPCTMIEPEEYDRQREGDSA